MSAIPWWSLPLVAGIFAVLGAVVAQLVSARYAYTRRAARRRRRWYDERRTAYVSLLAAYERAVARMRREFDGGITELDPLRYHDEVGTALTQVRLLASPAVRNPALAVHRLLADQHGPRPATARGEDFHEALDHVPLILHELELAVRRELEIADEPPPLPPEAAPAWRLRGRRPLPAVDQRARVDGAGAVSTPAAGRDT